MVRFVDVENMTRWIAAEGVQPIIAGMVGYLEHDFRRWTSFERIPRIASHSERGVIELMPTSDGESYCFKYVNGHPSNPLSGRQTVTAFGVLADVATGYPTFWSEMTLLTALRTAATSAMVARHLARPGSSTMAMIGTGSQSEFQALAFREILGVSTLRIWDTDPAAMHKFAMNMRPLGFDVTIATHAREAVAGADIITTCTADKANATVLTSDMVADGTHINAIGGDCPGKTELEAALVRAGTVFVEHTAQTRIEGEIQQLAQDHPVTEFWEVLVGTADGRSSDAQITIFDSVGFAIEDFTAMRYLRDSVLGSDYEVELDLIAEPADPKNLFALTSRVPARSLVSAR